MPFLNNKSLYKALILTLSLSALSLASRLSFSSSFLLCASSSFAFAIFSNLFLKLEAPPDSTKKETILIHLSDNHLSLLKLTYKCFLKIIATEILVTTPWFIRKMFYFFFDTNHFWRFWYRSCFATHSCIFNWPYSLRVCMHRGILCTNWRCLKIKLINL